MIIKFGFNKIVLNNGVLEIKKVFGKPEIIETKNIRDIRFINSDVSTFSVIFSVLISFLSLVSVVPEGRNFTDKIVIECKNEKINLNIFPAFAFNKDRLKDKIVILCKEIGVGN